MRGEITIYYFNWTLSFHEWAFGTFFWAFSVGPKSVVPWCHRRQCQINVKTKYNLNFICRCKKLVNLKLFNSICQKIRKNMDLFTSFPVNLEVLGRQFSPQIFPNDDCSSNLALLCNFAASTSIKWKQRKYFLKFYFYLSDLNQDVGQRITAKM